MFYICDNVQKIFCDIKDIEFLILCVRGPYNRYTNTPKLRSACPEVLVVSNLDKSQPMSCILCYLKKIYILSLKHPEELQLHVSYYIN